MAEQGTPQQEPAQVMQPYEAGFSTNFFLSHPTMGKQQFTFRGAFATDWVYVMVEAAEFIKHMREKGWQTEGDRIEALPQVQPSTPAPSQPQAVQGGYTWKMKPDGTIFERDRGKLILQIPAGMTEPNEIACPEHAGKTLKRRANEQGAWYSHKKDDDKWCSAVPHHMAP